MIGDEFECSANLVVEWHENFDINQYQPVKMTIGNGLRKLPSQPYPISHILVDSHRNHKIMNG